MCREFALGGLGRRVFRVNEASEGTVRVYLYTRYADSPWVSLELRAPPSPSRESATSESVPNMGHSAVLNSIDRPPVHGTDRVRTRTLVHRMEFKRRKISPSRILEYHRSACSSTRTFPIDSRIPRASYFRTIRPCFPGYPNLVSLINTPILTIVPAIVDSPWFSRERKNK